MTWPKAHHSDTRHDDREWRVASGARACPCPGARAGPCPIVRRGRRRPPFITTSRGHRCAADRCLAQPITTVIEPTARHAAVLRDLLGPVGAAGNLVSDAHLAALAIEHGAELCSADRDFGRFPGLRWMNPLA